MLLTPTLIKQGYLTCMIRFTTVPYDIPVRTIALEMNDKSIPMECEYHPAHISVISIGLQLNSQPQFKLESKMNTILVNRMKSTL